MRKLSVALAAVLLLLVGRSANATSFYAEALTSSAFPVFPNVAASVTLSVDFDPFVFDWTGRSGSPGLGSARVTETTPKTYTHHFDPTAHAASVLHAWLVVWVADDELDLTPETARIELGGALWKQGQATLNLFLGDITALGLITAEADTLKVTISSVSGSGLGQRDFNVLASALKVEFTPAPVTVPEPGAAFLLALGLFGLGRFGRRRSV